MAISKSFTNVADGAVDPDSPIDAALMTAQRDNDIHLREWLGKSYYAGAVEDHDHDGVNSKSVVLGDGVVTTAKIADLAVTIAKFVRTNAVAANASPVNLDSSPTTLVTVDLGTVNTGDKVLFSAPLTFVGATGTVTSRLVKSAGTAAVHPSGYHAGSSSSSAAADCLVSGIMNVETGGTLTITLQAAESGGAPSGSVSTGYAFLRALVLVGS